MTYAVKCRSIRSFAICISTLLMCLILYSFLIGLFFIAEFLVFFKTLGLFIYLWLCWVFVSVRGLSLVVASGGHSSSRSTGLSLSRPLLLRSTGSVIVAHGPSCSAACGIFPDQGLNPCPLHWQADSQPLRHQGSPYCWVLRILCTFWIQVLYQICDLQIFSSSLWLFILLTMYFTEQVFNFNNIQLSHFFMDHSFGFCT